jgi:hypothetical protein
MACSYWDTARVPADESVRGVPCDGISWKMRSSSAPNRGGASLIERARQGRSQRTDVATTEKDDPSVR